jgi:hypothetical protein
MAAVFTLAHAAALRSQIARFVTSAEGRAGWPLEPEWWWDIPVGPETVWIAGATAMAILALLGARVLGGPRTALPEASSRAPEVVP